MAESTSRSISERLRAAADRAANHSENPAQTVGFQQKAATATATQAQTQVRRQVEEQEEVHVAERTAIELKIKSNPFYAIDTDTQMTQEDKILQIANALDSKQQTMEKTRENFRLFQEYYTYVQSEELDQILENVRRLIRELEGRSKIEIANILENLRGMLNDVAASRDLIEVLRKARLDGKTVAELSAAFDRNEVIVKQLTELEEQKQKAEQDIETADRIVDARTKLRDEQEATWSHRLTGIFKRDTTYSDRVTAAQSVAETNRQALADVTAHIEQLTKERREEFEREPLKILRSIDEADDNLSQRLVSSARKGIGTIEGAQRSVLQLIQRALYSEGEVNQTSSRVADKGIVLSNLRSGLTLASRNTNDHKQELESKASQAEADLTAAKAPESGEPDILAAAKLEDAALRLKKDTGEVIDYQGRLNDTITEINGTIARNVERTQETDRQRQIVQGMQKSITTLNRSTLNTVAGDLDSVLHNLLADQTDETQSTIDAFGQAAEQMKVGALERMVDRGRDMHKREMAWADDSIKRLKAVTELIASTVEKSVDEGAEHAVKQRELDAATAELDLATSTMRTVMGNISNDAVSRGGSGPTRPDGVAAPQQGPTEPTPGA